MPQIEPYMSKGLPNQFLRWLERLRQSVLGIPTFSHGNGTPEANLAGRRGDRYYQDDGAAGSRLWYKSTEGGKTGWVNYG